MRLSFPSFGVLLLLLAGCATTAPPISETTRAASDVGDAPAFTSDVEIPGASGTIRGSMSVASGLDPRPTVLLLHGFPGGPMPPQSAVDYLTEQGMNVLYVNYRGMWTSDGSFSIDGAVRDAADAVAYLRSDAARSAFRVEPSSIVLWGQSFGGWVALNAAASDPTIECVATAAFFDVGALGRRLQSDEAYRQLWFQNLGQLTSASGPLDVGDSVSIDALVNGIMANADQLDAARVAPAIRDRAVLMLFADEDATAPPATHVEPF